MTNSIKIFLPTIISFTIGIFLTPLATHYFYKYKMWRRVSRKENIPEEKRASFEQINNEKEELRTPRTGGMIIWISVLLTLFILWIIDILFNNVLTNKLYFVHH